MRVAEKLGLKLWQILSVESLPKEGSMVPFIARYRKEQIDSLGMKLPGIVTNITKFGAFVDIGVHLDGLVHISKLADHFVKKPGDVVKIQQKVEVTVLEVDEARKRIMLSMQKNPQLNISPQ